eukprot:403341346
MYPGLQLRVEEDFLQIFTDEFFYVLPAIMEKVDEILPKQFQILNVKFSDIKFSDFQIDPSSANFSIDQKRHGIKLNWAKLINYHLHTHVRFGIFWFIAISWDIDIYLKDVFLENGFTITGNSHTGAPSLTLYETSLELGDSYYRMSGNFIMYLISWFTNLLLKYPLQVLIDLFLQPGVNFIINDIIIPDFLDNGLITIPGFKLGNLTDSLVVDITLPENPQFNDHTMDTFTDAAIYFKNHGKTFKSPTSPMRFQEADSTVQLVLSSYSTNQVIETVLETGLVVLPIDHTLVKSLIGIELTTTLMLVIIPELFYNFGSKDLNLVFTPITGTEIHWSNDNKTTDAHIKTLVDFIIVEADNSTKLAFQAIWDLEADLNLQIADDGNNTIQLMFETLELTNFNVTIDNCGVKSDEEGIKTRLNTIMEAVEGSANEFIKALKPTLPKFNTFDYKVHFDYQDDAFGTGIQITPKANQTVSLH